MILKSFIQYRVSSNVDPVSSTVHVDNITISGDGSEASPLQIKSGYLGSAALQDTSAFDPAGSASTAEDNASLYTDQKVATAEANFNASIATLANDITELDNQLDGKWNTTGATTITTPTITGDYTLVGKNTQTKTETSIASARPVINAWTFTANPSSAPSSGIDFHALDIQMSTAGSNWNNDAKLYPFEITTRHNTTGTCGALVSSFFNVQNTSTGTVGSMTATRVRMKNETGGNVTSSYGWSYEDGLGGAGTWTNQYALYIATMAAATNNWGLYSQAANNYADNISLGVTGIWSDSALRIKANSTTKAQILLTPGGSLLTTPVNGAIENSGTHLYYTAGGVRYQLDNQAGVSAWQLSGTSNISGVTSINSSTMEQLSYGGTATATANSQYHTNFNPSITARSTITDFVYGYGFKPTLTAAATGQTLIATEIKPTFVPGAFSPTSVALRIADASGNAYFNALNDQRILVGTATPVNSTTLVVDRGLGAVNNNVMRLSSLGTNLWTMAATGAITHSGTWTITAGVINAQNIGGTFAPSSGSGEYAAVNVSSTINQTGTASGDIYGLKYEPTVTSALGRHTAIYIASGQLVLNSKITPAQITADQNDYNPTGLNNTLILRVSSDASRNITSVAGGRDGRILIIMNVGSQNIVIKNDDGATGTAANRFALSADCTVLRDEAKMFVFDGTASRWRLIGKV